MDKIGVLIVDDHAIVREGMISLLASRSDIEGGDGWQDQRLITDLFF
jgi:DNA-binding NarL/FixJ family response regulator